MAEAIEQLSLIDCDVAGSEVTQGERFSIELVRITCLNNTLEETKRSSLDQYRMRRLLSSSVLGCVRAQ